MPCCMAQPQFNFDALYRAESRRVFATLVRLLGDFDLAEEALSEAWRCALEQWPREGVPANPRAWLVSTGRFKAIDAMRRHARFSALDEDQIENLPAPPDPEKESIEDDRLRLIFTCCHPALARRSSCAHAARGVRPEDRGRNSTGITWHTPCTPTSAGAWAGKPRPLLPMSGPSPWPARSPSGALSAIESRP